MVSEKELFAQEQEHLEKTYDTLLGMEKELEESIAAVAEKAAAEKRDIRDNLALNFDGDTDSMETYIEFEVMNHAIDHFNIERDSAVENLSRVKRLLKAPYFAKVQLRYAPDEDPEEYYIGSAGVSESTLAPLVIDWRSPVAETYYNQDNGHTWYSVDGRRIDVELLLRRQFELSANRLHAFFDTQIALEDPLLIRSLSRRRSDRMQAITATIQREQNAIVRHENVPVLLVNGIAGSGKTSVLLQRIAWLFYRQRDTLRPDEVVLMTLNPIFRRYIDQVLPDMGEMNPVSLTWRDFMDLAGVSGGREQFQEPDTSPDSLRLLEERLPEYHLSAEDLRPVRQKSIHILSPQKILTVLSQYPALPAGERLIQIAVEDLRELAKQEIRRKERDDPAEESGAQNFPGAETWAENTPRTDSGDSRRDSRSASAAENNRIRSQYGGAFQAISSCQWLDIGRIGRRILQKDRLTDVEYLYLRMLLTGQKDIRTKYVMIDEVQDYTAAQLILLRKYYPRARFMLLGDEYQAVREGTVTFTQIHALFGDSSSACSTAVRDRAQRRGPAFSRSGGQPVTELFLTTSYRSSPEITALFAALLPPQKQILVSSVQPPGRAPSVHVCSTPEDYSLCLQQAVRTAASEEGLTAVICAGMRKMEKISALLQDCGPVPMIRSGDRLPARGVFLITLLHAKGLEFDGVILPDADAETYPDTVPARHRLYTALSRATHRLTILAQKELSPLLEQDPGSVPG